MSKNKVNHLEKTIMTKIAMGEVAMKPRWYFILGSILMFLGFTGAGIGAIFLTNLSLFMVRQHGPMGELKLQGMLDSFPWWIPILAVFFIISGIFFLKKYDFSYRKNFDLVVGIFITTVLFAAILIELSGINSKWLKRGPLRNFSERKTIENNYRNQQYKIRNRLIAK